MRAAVVSVLILLGCLSAVVRCLPTTSTWASANRPSYVECVSSNECSFDSCCVLGMGRYSIPTCQKKLHLYEACRPASDETTNTTITYLDGQLVSLYDVRLIVCPCADGLSCDSKSGRCVDVDGASSFNQIHDTGPED